MIRIASTLLLALGFAGSAQAYELRAKSENSMVSVEELSEMVKRIGDASAHNIPDSDQVRVYAITEARPRANSQEILYNHRVELRKLFDGRDTPPYPVGGWFVIYTSEIYGIGPPEKMKSELEGAIKKFFTDLRGLDPKKDAP